MGAFGSQAQFDQCSTDGAFAAGHALDLNLMTKARRSCTTLVADKGLAEPCGEWFDTLLALETGVVNAAADVKGLAQRARAVMFKVLVHGRLLYLLGLLIKYTCAFS